MCNQVFFISKNPWMLNDEFPYDNKVVYEVTLFAIGDRFNEWHVL